MIGTNLGPLGLHRPKRNDIGIPSIYHVATWSLCFRLQRLFK